jgi:hypothetical protein
MKKLMLIAALMLTSNAFASDYEQTQIKMAYCKNIAEDGQEAYVDKGLGLTREMVFNTYAGMMAMERGYNRNSEFFGVGYGYDSAISEKDAYTRTWAHCMDELGE